MKHQTKKLHRMVGQPPKHWVGDGFLVSTMFSLHTQNYHFLSPFIMMDYAAPKWFDPSSEKKGVGRHPHRGFETVTFALQGSVDHKDSSGGGGRIEAGDVQWMTAGSGIVHEEFHSEEFRKTGGDFEMIQLWVNLPAEKKMTAPRYQNLKKDSFPIIELNDGLASLKVIAGEYAPISKSKGPAITHTPINIFILNAHEECDLSLTLPEGSNLILVQIKNGSDFQGKRLDQGEVAIFEREGDKIELRMQKDAQILVLNGQPIDEPAVAYGPFVMNTPEEISQAIDDFRQGKMGTID